MAMSLLDSIEKLITEHGSAVVLREHLSLLKTQATILETENSNFKTEIEDLRNKIQNCETINKELNRQISHYKETSVRHLNVMGVDIPYRAPKNDK